MPRPFAKRHRTGAVLVIVAVLAVPCLVGIRAQQTERPRTRLMSYGIDVTIPNRLLPDDEVAVITREFDLSVWSQPPTAKQAIETAVERRADLVAAVDVDDVSYGLVEDGTWINTRIAGKVSEIIRMSPRRLFAPGQRVEVNVSGGELRIGKVLVKTEAVLRLPVPRQYLLFIQTHGDPPFMRTTFLPLLIEKGRLVNTWPTAIPEETPNPVVGLTLREVVRLVKRVPE